MEKLFKGASELADRKEDFAIAVITGRSGSAPREAGAAMLIRADGAITGTVGGGLSEAEVIKAGQEAIKTKKPKLLRFDMSNDDAGESGLICGGETEVWVDYVDASLPENKLLYSAAADVFKSGRRAWYGFYVGDDLPECRQCLIMADGTVIGAYEGDGGSLTAGEKQFKGYDVFTVSERKKIFLIRIGTEAKAILLGAGHVSLELARLLKNVGFETVVIDDRDDFSNVSRFPTADRVLTVSTLETGIFDIEPCDENTFVVILTRGHSFDRDVLAQALKTNAKYIGMIGSRNKRDAIYDNLLKSGFTQADIDRVYSPIGLDIASETPEEIAVSIAGEMIRVRRRGR